MLQDDNLDVFTVRDSLNTLAAALQVNQNTELAYLVREGPVHYVADYGDTGWGCGYRNLQIMISSLYSFPSFSERLIAGKKQPLMPYNSCS